MQGERLILALLLASGSARAAEHVMYARRTPEPIHLDGKLDEPAWAEAPPYGNFVQSYPNEGSPPSERTEVRVLYDDDNLYVGVICFDREPSKIVRRLGRRDSPPPSDDVQVAIDSEHNQREAFMFEVNAAGVLLDGLLFQGSNFTSDWDAVWDARTAMRPDGWSAEFSIPLHVLRFKEAHNQVWGFAVRREVPHDRETIDSVLLPRSTGQIVQRFGILTDVIDLKPRADIELAPYAAARATVRPEYSDATRPHPRLIDPSGDVGLDLKASLLSNLTLNATFNPDFGQVEADQIILNLTTYEPFFPEKRPFFTQGMDLFQPVGGQNTQQLFYSRRIGLDSPIFAAAKLTGQVADGLEVGVLDAVVGGFWQPNADESNPDPRYQFHLVQPLHFAPNDAYPESPVAPENFFVVTARKQVFQNSTVGATVTSALPLASAACPIGSTEGNTPVLTPAMSRAQVYGCSARGGNTAGLDWFLRSPNGDWQFYGQVDASQEVRGPNPVVLYDGTRLGPGDTGFGTYFTAGKLGGEPYRFQLSYELETPKLDLNALGYLRTQNFQSLTVQPSLFKTQYHSLQNLSAWVHVNPRWSADGNWTYRGGNYAIGFDTSFASSSGLGCELGRDDAGYEIREVQYAGVALERRPDQYFTCWGRTDRNLPLSVGGWAVAAWLPRGGPTPHAWAGSGGVSLAWRPHPRLETQLGVSGGDQPLASHYIGQFGPQFLFGDLDSKTLSLTLRQTLVITPRLTLQAYGQLFSGYGRYGPYYSIDASTTGTIFMRDMTPYTPDPLAFPDPSFHTSALALNIVLRWEYRLGSTLFVVYSRSQSEQPYPTTPFPAGIPADVAPDQLFQGPATDLFLIKWSYWWST